MHTWLLAGTWAQGPENSPKRSHQTQSRRHKMINITIIRPESQPILVNRMNLTNWPVVTSQLRCIWTVSKSSYDPTLKCVLRVSGKCLEAVWRIIEGVWRLIGGCLEGYWSISRGSYQIWSCFVRKAAVSFVRSCWIFLVRWSEPKKNNDTH